ncbi:MULTISPECIES: His-Xaa-Ser system radical SAM maturase HxsB [unclassified Bradyrhizobium]|uniref:His-Xaa-Ser system radical SAM maturase HxsB n=1 Tax=unclassified Bradyrhizobium TaxID=2631580 RepID=UPI0028E7E50F|nr:MULTISPECIES: His-Xaa-Ser system radical SAM maturase HxsB [unclassified Bradyrhizobium]
MIPPGAANHTSISSAYNLLPFRFARLPGKEGTVVVTSEGGEYTFISSNELVKLASMEPITEAMANDLEAAQIIHRGNADLSVRLLATKLRTRKSFLRFGPALHIFVVSLRCDHSCAYCQVSRQASTDTRFDMSVDTAAAAVERVLESPSPDLTVEFQGGEPLLAFDRIRQIVDSLESRLVGRRVTFTITSTLHHLTDEILEFLRENRFHVSTSLDGPSAIHDANRPLPSRDSHALTLEGINNTRGVLGAENVNALVTLTSASLQNPQAIVDEYVRLGFRAIFLRPLSLYGFAAKSERRLGYGMDRFLSFYEAALDYIIELNRQGVSIVEVYAQILLRSILTHFPTNYVDLRSPVGAGYGALVYNYDGGVYASDEGRMLAEMGNDALRLGSVHEPYSVLMKSDAMRLLAGAGLAESLPGCADCAFVPYCGPDPAGALSRFGDPVGHRALSEHCKRHLGMFNIIFRKLAEGEPATMRVFNEWVFGRSRALGGPQ